MSDNFVVGGGVAGLIFCYLNKNFLLIDSKPLGQLNSGYILGPRYLQKDGEKKVEHFIINNKKELDLRSIKVAIDNIGFESNGEVNSNLDNEFISKYNNLSRSSNVDESSFMSGHKTCIDYFTFGLCNAGESYLRLFRSIYRKLVKEDRIIFGEVEKIDLEKKMLYCSSQDKYSSSYDKLILTIHPKIMKKIVENSILDNFDFKVEEKNFYITKYDNCNLELSKNYGYIYSIEDEYTRKTFQDSYIVYETKDSIDSDFIDNNKIFKRFENLPIQISQSLNLNNLNENVFLLGRYAQWKHSIRFDTLFEEIDRIQKEI